MYNLIGKQVANLEEVFVSHKDSYSKPIWSHLGERAHSLLNEDGLRRGEGNSSESYFKGGYTAFSPIWNHFQTSVFNYKL